MNQNRVCIVGAGIAGLASAKVFREDGFEVALYEKEPTIGGVWAESRTYPGLRANDTRNTYAFSDFPYPKEADLFPTAEQIRRYLNSYADHFGLRAFIRTAMPVTSIRKAPGGDGFLVTAQPEGSRAAIEEHYDFVAICNGTFSEPSIPSIPGAEQFQGLIGHSSEVRDGAMLKGKRVVVVGGAKSALDCAVASGELAQSTVIVIRRPHWMFPRQLPGGISPEWFVGTRFWAQFIPYYKMTRFQAWLHGRAQGLVRGFGKVQSDAAVKALCMPPELIPPKPLPDGAENVGVCPEFYEAYHKDKVAVRRGEVVRFLNGEELELSTGERIAADVVIFGTGWRQGIGFLEPEIQAQVFSNGEFRLYRNILPPREQRLGFAGYASGLACQLSAEMGAHWLSQHFRGELPLPNVEEMERQIEDVARWRRKCFPRRPEGYFIGGNLVHYLDELMEDMGLRKHRKGNPLAEYMGPLLAERYRDVGKERRQLRGRAAAGVSSVPGKLASG